MAAETLEQKAREATTDVMLCIRRVTAALEAREKELLGRIEKARLLKFAALKARDEGLRNGIARLSRAIDKLTDAMESSTLASNPLDLLVTKDMASAEVLIALNAAFSSPSRPKACHPISRSIKVAAPSFPVLFTKLCNCRFGFRCELSLRAI
jgi:hypothetical protein